MVGHHTCSKKIKNTHQEEDITGELDSAVADTNSGVNAEMERKDKKNKMNEVVNDKYLACHSE